MSARLSVATVALAGLVLSTGCSSGTLLRPNQQERASNAELRERVLELQRQVTVNELELARLRERLAALEAGGAPPTRSSTTQRPRPRRQPAEVTVQPETLRGASSAPAPVERTARPTSSTRTGGGIESADLEILPEESAPTAQPTGAPSSAGSDDGLRAPLPPAGAGAGAPAQPSGNAQTVYDQGFALYHQGRYVDAETTFRRYLQNHSGTDLDDNARFWIGASRYAREDYQGALAAFRETIERHPKGNKAADALLQVGRCLERLGDREGAREAYGEVVSRFPNSAAAAVAEEYRTALP